MINEQLIKYFITGFFSSLIHFCTASMFVLFIYESLMFSNMAGFLISFIWSYYAQSKFVFKSSFSTKKGIKFFIVQANSLILAVNFAKLAATRSTYIKISIVVLLLPICAFVIHKLWTFVDDR